MLKYRHIDAPVFALFLIYAMHLAITPIDGQLVVEAGRGSEGFGQFITGLIGRIIFGSYLLLRFPNLLKSVPLVNTFMVVILFWALLSATWSENIGLSLYRAVDLFFLVLLPSFFLIALGAQRFWSITFYVLAAVLVASVVLAVLGSPYATMGGAHAGRWRGLFDHKNNFGPFAALVLAIARHYPFNEIGRAQRLGVCLIAALAVLMSGSATAITIAVTTIAFPPLWDFVGESKLRSWLKSASMIFACVFAVWCGSQIYPALANALGRDEGLTGRVDIWQAAWIKIVENPWGSGYGLGGGQQTLAFIRAYTGWLVAPSTHNGLLTMALDLGILASGLFAIWLAAPVFFIGKNKESKFAAVIAAQYLLLAFSDSTAAAYLNLPIFLLLALSACLPKPIEVSTAMLTR